MIKIKVIFLVAFFSKVMFSQNDLIQIKQFGENPGNLKMFYYEPDSLHPKMPLVIVLHGCTQTAKSCAEHSGWNKLAKLHHFYVLYPEQSLLNNPENCFNWFRENDQVKDKGEPASIVNMINYLKKNKSIDTSKIFITGMSAGAAMSTNLLAVYPQLFNKGAIYAGGPYKSAQSSVKAGAAMVGMVSKSPEDWGDLIKTQNPNYNGTYPSIAIFHGGIDPIVSTNNANQLIKQWVNIHNTDYVPDSHFEHFNNYKDVELEIYNNNKNEEVVRYYRIKGIGHVLALDTGSCSTQGGKTGLFAIHKKFHSTYWIADYFGIIKAPYSISGPILVSENQKNILYFVPDNKTSKYQWNLPSGYWIIEGQNTHQITIECGMQNGIIEVIEKTESGCMLEPARLSIQIKN
jgi:poly(hydroxyalkanoate) depolymerase family esterase